MIDLEAARKAAQEAEECTTRPDDAAANWHRLRQTGKLIRDMAAEIERLRERVEQSDQILGSLAERFDVPRGEILAAIEHDHQYQISLEEELAVLRRRRPVGAVK